MAQQLVKLTWCDQHLEAKDEQVEADTYVVSLYGSQTEVDLCAECAAPLLELHAFLQTYGREQVKRGKRSTSPEGSGVCPECGKTLKDEKGVMSHMRNMHNMTLGEWQAQHAGGTSEQACDCGRVFATAQGLKRHQTVQGH